ncbi:MAG: NifU family protein [Planctomycetota bacterium]
MAEAPNADWKAQVAKIIDERMRPALQGDGGDIELVSVSDDGVVSVRLQGACVGCPGAQMTLKMGVERNLKAAVPQVKEVVTAN